MMRASHVVALLSLSLWCVFSVWVGADSFGVGECVAVALIWAGLWVAFAILRSLNSQSRDGRTSWPLTLVVGVVAFLLSLAHLPRTAYIERRHGEPDSSFIPRAIREIARANA